ncbi:hypothetical protein GGI07_003795 [Coemansia sp. Benny D115]|nr:hypothetical protein GGI07_003795 [Coemansia sp. Benny D115]
MGAELGVWVQELLATGVTCTARVQMGRAGGIVYNSARNDAILTQRQSLLNPASSLRGHRHSHTDTPCCIQPGLTASNPSTAQLNASPSPPLRRAMADRTGQAVAADSRPPFKYDIRVTGGLFADGSDNGTTTKVSVKILGNEDGDIVVEQDDSLASPSPSTDGSPETRRPQFTTKRANDGALELHIHALPTRPKTAGALKTSASSTDIRGSGNGGALTPTTRASTRLSGFSRADTSTQSVMELRPAFEDNTPGTQTPVSIEHSPTPDLVGGGGRSLVDAAEGRPRSASVAVMEDKCTMTTWRGIPGDMSRASPVPTEQPASRASTVLRGGGAGCMTADDERSLFSVFNGPPVAPSESRASARPRSLPRPVNKYEQLPPRRSQKDRINYRERAEKLLTQYFPDTVLKRYLDELRRRYRFMGEGGMTSAEITALLDETTADSQLKEQLRASLEALVVAPMSESEMSDHEGSVCSGAPSQRTYLSMRGTELRSVLDRTSHSPGPNAVLVGGGQSMEDMSAATAASAAGYGTVRSDQMSVAASVLPAESTRSGETNAVDSDGAESTSAKTRAVEELARAATPARVATPGRISSLAQKQIHQARPESVSTARSEQPRPDTSAKANPNPKRESAARPVSVASSYSHPSSGPAANGSANSTSSGKPKTDSSNSGPPPTDPGYWEDGDKYKMRPPDMTQAFTVLKSQPIFVREMSSSDIKFRSPFSQQNQQQSQRSSSADPAPQSVRASTRASTTSKKSAADVFSERTPMESKVAQAVSELEEVLRRTEAATLAGIESDFQSSSGRSRHSSSPARSTTSALSSDSLVGGGASSRSASVATRISAIGSKYAAMRHESPSRLSASQSTIRTDILLKEGIEFGEQIEEDGEDALEEAVVPVESSARSESVVSLPMGLEDMPPELAAVLMRTGGLENAKLRRTSTPMSIASNKTTSSNAARVATPAQSDVRQASRLSRKSHVSRASQESRASRASKQPASATNRSLTELDIVMGRTADVLSRASQATRSSAAPSRISVASRVSAVSAATASSGVLRGGSGTPVSPSSARDLDNELAQVLRRTTGYAPSSISSYAPSEASVASGASGLRSVVSPQPTRPQSGAKSPRLSYGYAPPAQSPPPMSPPPMSPTPRRAPLSPAPVPLQAREPQQQQQQQRAPQQPPTEAVEEEEEREQSPPSPFPFRAPTPVFGRFPSPPAYIKNRGKAPENEQESDREDVGQRAQSQASQVSQLSQASQVLQAVRAYEDEPVVERLDLETGSLASRRSRPRSGSEFGSASTLMNMSARDDFNLPKVVEEDVDSLASYTGSVRRAVSPNLVGGGGRPLPAHKNKHSFAADSGRAHCESSGCCGVCGQGVGRGDVVVRPQVMHARCLRCEACDCMLTSSTFRAVDGHVYCEADYQQLFGAAGSRAAAKVVEARPGMSEKQFAAMNKAIMESFTSVDDFLLHMRQLRQTQGGEQMVSGKADPSKVQRAGDLGVDRQTHYEREQVTSPSGTPWITERVVDKKVKTKVLEKRYPASALGDASSVATTTIKEPPTLVGGGGAALRAPQSTVGTARSGCHSSASRPSTSLLNDTKLVNGWEHPLCPGCSNVVYLNDRVVHEGYGYHKACMRCRQCSQVIPTTSAIRIKGALYCKKHGTELLRRRSILMRKKSTMGRRSRHQRRRSGVSVERFANAENAVPESQPPLPAMPMYSGVNTHQLPVPPQIGGGGGGAPRRVTTALRSFLEAAAAQIDLNPTMPPDTPEPSDSGSPVRRAFSPPARNPLAPVATARPLPQPRPKSTPAQADAKRPVSRSIFAGTSSSRESLYDPNVVNALRQEAQRQINGSQVSISQGRMAPSSPGGGNKNVQRMLSPCGPSIADALQKYSGRDGRVSVSSQFDPFLEASQDGINQPRSPVMRPQQQQKMPSTFGTPNVHLENLEQRFRNANFRPPWALKSQTTFD